MIFTGPIDWKQEAYSRPDMLRAIDRYFPAVRFDDLMDDGQSQADAVVLGRNERCENPF